MKINLNCVLYNYGGNALSQITNSINLNSPNPSFQTFTIKNRRYLGNKYKLLHFIKDVVNKECKNIENIADVFSGTGVVASAFIDKQIITNDLLYSNYICNFAWFGNQPYNQKTIEKYITYYNLIDCNDTNYMTDNFSNTFFSYSDCSKIGFIRENIENEYIGGFINDRERALLITSLLYAMDKIANTCGHYDAYIKNNEFDKSLQLFIPAAKVCNNLNNQCFNMDANQLVKQIAVDLLYLDPPYNSRQYSDAYHVLENVARWEKPVVHGIARKMDRKNLKSDYCTKNATKAFEDLILNSNARYILLSYNNMATKGNDRSNAKISDSDILNILEKKGTVKVFSEKYKSFTTGKSNIEGNEERLFLCKCFEKKEQIKHTEIIQSPLNYTGGKFKLLPQLLPHFPKKINTFVDLFCGGCNVGINIQSKKTVYNDINESLINIFQTFERLDKRNTFDLIFQVIEKYNLSNVSEYGYAYYNCNSSEGLSKYNKEYFIKLRQEFNSLKVQDDYYYIMLYVLIIYSFNNQIRFNKRGEFNLPVGKRDFNQRMQTKLSKFIDRLKINQCSFINCDFKGFDISNLTGDDFVYIDPPYLITCATYNEQNNWNEQSERDLLNFIDNLHENNIKFALSNVLKNKGKENTILNEWLEKNKDKYNLIYLDYGYSNSNYHAKNRYSETDEVLVINY